MKIQTQSLTAELALSTDIFQPPLINKKADK